MTYLHLEPEVRTIFDSIRHDSKCAERLAEVDFQLASYKKDARRYILPNACQWMLTLIETYGEDPEGWLSFLREMKDSFAKRSDARGPVQSLYRTVFSREDARIRRLRKAKLIDVYERTHGKFASAFEKAVYLKDVAALWALQRENLRAEWRAKTPDQKLTKEDLDDINATFWEDIRRQLDGGIAPDQAELVRKMRAAKAANRLYYGPKPKNQD